MSQTDTHEGVAYGQRFCFSLGVSSVQKNKGMLKECDVSFEVRLNKNVRVLNNYLKGLSLVKYKLIQTKLTS